MLNFKRFCCSPIFKVYILIIFFNLQSFVVFGQVDSLATKSYDELTKAYYEAMSSDFELALVYSEAAYAVAKQEKNTLNTAYALYNLADVKSFLSDNVKALEHLATAINLAEQLNNNILFYDLYNLKGIIATEMGNYVKALKAYMKSKEYAVIDGNELNKTGASINIGFIKKMNKDYEESISIFKENLEKIKQMDLDSVTEAHNKRFLYINLSDAYLRMKELGSEDYINEAEYYNNLGFESCSKTKNVDAYYSLLINKAIINYEKKQYAESIKLASDIKEYAVKTKDTISLATMYFYIGKSYHSQEKHKEAIENLEKFYEIIQKSEKKYSNEYQIHGLLAESYAVIDDVKKFRFHRKEHDRLQKESEQESVKVISAIHTKYDLPLMKDKLKNIEAAFKKQETRKNWLYGISGFLVLVLIGGFFFYKLKVKRIQKRVEAVLQKVIYLENEQEKQQEQEANKTAVTSSISEKVTDEKASLLLEKLAQFEKREEYLSLDCSLAFVAEKLASNTSYVSNVINNYKHKTFKVYITELRINAALIRLKKDEKLRSYTIKAIAEEFGFKRQETFSKAFKAQTAIYPSQYLKKLREDLEID
ncbi:MAG: helix-turn-helix domain-containing protein [Kordia sp.]|uniref:helix-turn-helix domain-containing protein n=1 Tax=Kordia sp. TaxID=1965332 RepID=UPI00385AF5DC